LILWQRGLFFVVIHDFVCVPTCVTGAL